MKVAALGSVPRVSAGSELDPPSTPHENLDSPTEEKKPVFFRNLAQNDRFLRNFTQNDRFFKTRDLFFFCSRVFRPPHPTPELDPPSPPTRISTPPLPHPPPRQGRPPPPTWGGSGNPGTRSRVSPPSFIINGLPYGDQLTATPRRTTNRSKC